MRLRLPGNPASFPPLLALLSAVSLAGATIAVGGSGCKASSDQGSVAILTVDDPFTGPPAATQITVQGIAYDDGGADGAVTTLARGSATAGSLDLGTYDEQTTESILVTATDSAGTTVARGQTLAVELGALAGLTLGVFVQRTGSLSRMPTALSDGRPSPLLSILGGRYVLVSGGADTSLQEQTNIYDLVSWAPLASPPSLPFAPASLAIAGLQALAISSSGAQWYDLTASSVSDAAAPTGTTGQWTDVAGGQTIVATDDSKSYVVGGTRPCTGGAQATTTVLVVTAAGGLSWADFSTARCGATAAYVDGIGLVIAGGNVENGTTGGTVPGVESLTDEGHGFPYDYAADPAEGAGMVRLGPAGSTSSSNVLVVGGVTSQGGALVGGTSARVITVPCGSTVGWAPCATTPWSAVLPTSLAFTQVFAIDAASALVVGEDASGTMHAYRLSSSSVAEVPFRIKRSHARAIRLPLGPVGTGPIAVVGGDANIEAFIP